MPKEAERKLKAKARKKSLTGDRFRAYVYGGLRNTGWKPKHELRHGFKRSKKKYGLKRSGK